MYLLGYDIGSSTIKAALTNADTHELVGLVQYPEQDMDIISLQSGWAEQHPEIWWENVCRATGKLLNQYSIQPTDIQGIGISYQMHGLVLIDKNCQVLRPSIIWCDSRAVEIGNRAFAEIGEEKCLKHLLNSPGNFTASKLKWVKEEEPEIFGQIFKALLPGDYIALKLTGEAATTASGLSEGTLWDFQKNAIADFVLDYFEFDENLFPEVVPTFSLQGRLTKKAAKETGLSEGIPVAYRAGDQPNNALTLNVLNPGEVAATGGTSGVVYGIVDKPVYDPESRVNGFAHVNHSKEKPRIGILLCINGAGIQYSWMKQQIAPLGTSFDDMEQMVATVPVNSDGLRIIPFGNGSERILGNKNLGSHIVNLHFNRHSRAHFFRAALEGIAFSFAYGLDIFKQMGLTVDVIKVGNDNLFQSETFSSTISNLTACQIEVVATTGAAGAAKAAGMATGIYGSLEAALRGNDLLKTYEPIANKDAYGQAYQTWKTDLERIVRSI